jgi:hypothetical protein
MIHKRLIIRLLGALILFLLVLSWFFPGFGQSTLDQLENTEEQVIIILEDFSVRLQKAQVKAAGSP